MVYGDGDGKIFIVFVTVDVTGHEHFHLVIASESNLTYSDQPGALNESGADDSGATTDMWRLKMKSRDYHWLIGRDIFTDDAHKHGVRALRDMLNPGTAFDNPDLGKDDQPATMSKYVQGGDVHTNSGIPNKAYATFCVAVDGYAFEGPWQVFYHTYAGKDRVGSDASFQDFANRTVEVCDRDFHSGVDALRKAWAGVEIIVK
jgi:Zn-dependent metalloprotease